MRTWPSSGVAILGLGLVADAAVFLPVEVNGPEVTVPPEPLPVVNDSRVEIALSSGHWLTLIGAFDPDLVARLAHGLMA